LVITHFQELRRQRFLQRKERKVVVQNYYELQSNSSIDPKLVVWPFNLSSARAFRNLAWTRVSSGTLRPVSVDDHPTRLPVLLLHALFLGTHRFWDHTSALQSTSKIFPSNLTFPLLGRYS